MMTWVKRWFVLTAFGGMLLPGPTGCVVAPVEPGYVAPPPVVVIPPHRPYGYYAPYRYYRPYRPYYRSWPYGYRWSARW
jgi:hypothetical protein